MSTNSCVVNIVKEIIDVTHIKEEDIKKEIFKIINKYDIKEIETNDIRNFLINYKQNNNDIKTSTINSFIFCFNSFFKYLFNNEIIYKNKALYFECFKCIIKEMFIWKI